MSILQLVTTDPDASGEADSHCTQKTAELVHRGQKLRYHVLSKESSPDLTIFFGRRISRYEKRIFYVSATIPPSIQEWFVRTAYDLHADTGKASDRYQRSIYSSLLYRHDNTALFARTFAIFFHETLVQRHIALLRGSPCDLDADTAEDMQTALYLCEEYLRKNQLPSDRVPWKKPPRN